MAPVACSKVDTVNAQATDAGVQVTACGALSPTQAAQIAAGQLEHFRAEGLAALGGIENSRSVARLLTFGDSNIIDSFVADGQSELHDALVKLRDEQLVASNVESTSDSTVTFLLRPETLCKSTSSSMMPSIAAGGTASATGGATSVSLDPDCVTQANAHPTRIQVTRIACTSGDNVAINVLVDAAKVRVLSAAFYPEHIEFNVDVGAYLRQVRSVSYSSATPGTVLGAGGTAATTTSTREEKPIATAANGEIAGTLTLVGSHHCKGVASIVKPIDVILNDDAATHLQAGAISNALLVEANGDAKTISASINTAELDWQTKFVYFINDFFGLETTAGADTAAPVALRVPEVQGTVNFDGATDTVTASNLTLGGSGFTATQGSNTLLTFTATNEQGSPIDATFAGRTNNDLALGLPKGLAVKIKYGLQPVLSLVQNPANFIASDTLTVSAASGSNLALLNDPYTNSIPVIQSPTGQLLRVDAGTFSMASATWPGDTVTVSASQCLTRTVTDVTGHNNLLDDFTTGTCAQQ